MSKHDPLNVIEPTKEEDPTHFGYHSIAAKEKTQRVKQVFQSVASHYDLMNDLMSLGLHRLWKQIAFSRMKVDPGQRILDLACGTGDLAVLIADVLYTPNPFKRPSLSEIAKCSSELVICDINPSMLNLAKDRMLDQGFLHGVTCIQANAEQLPFPNEYFDAISIGFGLRNVTFKSKALAEMARVLKPLGRVVILEFSHPNGSFLKPLYDLYSFTVLPWLGKKFAKDAESYQYLAESIRMHPNQESLKAMMEIAGFGQISYQNLNGGIVAIHLGFKQYL